MRKRLWVGTGYDLAHEIRKFLSDVGKEHLSIAEVMLAEGSAEVTIGPQTFVSHQQKFHIGYLLGKLYNRTELDFQLTWWVDFFLLRQCRQDFIPQQMITLIGEIGSTFIEKDKDFEHFRRSFCVLELYASISSASTIETDVITSDFVDFMKCNTVDAAAARTRSDSDKAMIDKFIFESIGFERFNQVVTKNFMLATTQTLKVNREANLFLAENGFM